MNEGLLDEEQVKELIYPKGKTISWYDDGSQYFKGCRMTVQIMFVLVGPESQNRNNEADHKTFPSLKLLKSDMDFLSEEWISFPELFKLWMPGHLPEVPRWEARMAALQGPFTQGIYDFNPFPKLICCLIVKQNTEQSSRQSVAFTAYGVGACCTRE